MSIATSSSSQYISDGMMRSCKPSPERFTPGDLLRLAVIWLAALATISCGGNGPKQNPTTAGTPETESGKKVTLAWDPSATVVHGYHVYRSDKTGGPYEKLTSAPVTKTTYTDSTVRSGRTYYYVVTSVGFDGKESGYSNEIVVKAP